MIYTLTDKKYQFRYSFDTDTGAYIRTGILNDEGKDTGEDPFMGSFPHLIDVGVMGSCRHGRDGRCMAMGTDCYQSGHTISQTDMSVDDFEWIARQCRGRCNQLALGGRGDPDEHEDFEELLRISRRYDLVPNFTTSGYGMNEEKADIISQYCGAVAVSFYRAEYTYDTIRLLVEAGVKTNIHYVVGSNTIDEAVKRLKDNDFPPGVNAVIFLLYKPVGEGRAENMLNADDDRVRAFFESIELDHPFKVGLDSCSVPGVVDFCKAIDPSSLEACEAARFSCYIGPDMVMSPCSFDRELKFAVSLKGTTIDEVWNSQAFEAFRSIQRDSCRDCEKKPLCMGGCPIIPESTLCKRFYIPKVSLLNRGKLEKAP